MNHLLDGGLLLSLFFAGLAGSLHCVAMCGPILIGLQASLGGRGAWALYHTGRLWTYGMLGWAAGWLGAELRHSSIDVAWQRALATLAALAVIFGGAAALGWLPGLRLKLSAPESCATGPRRWPWLTGLIRQPGAAARLLLGAIMGLLPCGLVYAALLVAASAGGPVIGALAMLCFGLGTLPALTALLLGGRLLPARLRTAGPRLAAAVLFGVGLLMLMRALWMPTSHGHL